MKSIVSAKKKKERQYHGPIWGNANASYAKREYAPGQHGQRKKKMTDYGEQLNAKQRLKTYYGNVSEKQFHKYYVEAIRRTGDAAENRFAGVSFGQLGIQSKVRSDHLCCPPVRKPWPHYC